MRGAGAGPRDRGTAARAPVARNHRPRARAARIPARLPPNLFSRDPRPSERLSRDLPASYFHLSCFAITPNKIYICIYDASLWKLEQNITLFSRDLIDIAATEPTTI